MNIFKKLFGGKSSQETSQLERTPSTPAHWELGLADRQHPARQLIDQASRIADNGVRTVTAGTTRMFQTDGKVGAELVELIDQALELSPNDTDLLLAKSAALCCEMSFKSAEDVIDNILAREPSNLDAWQRKEQWSEWPHVFQLPTWSTSITSLGSDSQVLADLRQMHRVQLVRDGLQVGIVIVCPADGATGGDIAAKTPCKLIPVLSDTPSGLVFAHYAVVHDHPTDPLKYEAFLSVWRAKSARSGYWLVQRLSRIGSCFIVVVDGERVIYNVRHTLPANVVADLRQIAAKLNQSGATPDDVNLFQKAMQWHMKNFDLGSIK